MNLRKFVSAAVIAAAGALLPASADAKTNIHIGVGVGLPGPGYYEPYPYYGAPYVRPYYRRIGCQAGANIVRDYGYRRVYARECVGGTYSYIGWRRGGRFIIFVNSRNGALLGRRPI